MRRRDVITGIAGAAFTGTLGPLAINAQPARPRKLAVMMATGQTDEYVAALGAFEQAVAALGWQKGHQSFNRRTLGGRPRAPRGR